MGTISLRRQLNWICQNLLRDTSSERFIHSCFVDVASFQPSQNSKFNDNDDDDVHLLLSDFQVISKERFT